MNLAFNASTFNPSTIKSFSQFCLLSKLSFESSLSRSSTMKLKFSQVSCTHPATSKLIHDWPFELTNSTPFNPLNLQRDHQQKPIPTVPQSPTFPSSSIFPLPLCSKCMKFQLLYGSVVLTKLCNKLYRKIRELYVKQGRTANKTLQKRERWKTENASYLSDL
jgi:hypothetical protein